MAFSDSELKFINENKDLIEKGTYEELSNKISSDLYGTGQNRLRILLSFLKLGPRGFSLTAVTSPLKITLEGVLINRVSGINKPNGVAMLPSLFRAQTEVVLYQISKGLIASQEVYKLRDKASLDEIMISKNYNLAVLNKPPYTKLVSDLFGGKVEVSYFLRDSLDRALATSMSVGTIGEIRTNAAEILKNKLEIFFPEEKQKAMVNSIVSTSVTSMVISH